MNEVIMNCISWLENNKEWLFSGLGGAIILGVCGWFFSKKSDKTLTQNQKGQRNSMNVQAGRDLNGTVIDGLQQKQAGGDGSLNIQTQVANITATGLSYSDVKAIAEELFKENFPKLKDEAQQCAEARATEIANQTLKTLQNEAPGAINAFADPDMQYVFFEAQKAYARSGKQVLQDLLVDILVKRATSNSQDLQKIVLNEALQTAPKLTTTQLDSISMRFIIRYTRNFKINSIPTFHSYFQECFVPFCENLTKQPSDYQHIEYTGCGTVSLESIDLYAVLIQHYPGVLCKGISDRQINDNLQEEEKNRLEQFFISCIRNPSLKQVNAMDATYIETLGREYSFDQKFVQKLKHLQNQNLLSQEELQKEMVLVNPLLEKLWDVWTNSKLKNLELTSVGIALAQANIKRKIGIEIPLDIWIK